MNSEPPLLRVSDLRVSFPSAGGTLHPVDGVSFSVNAGETLVILGESGGGKSMMVQAIAGIVPSPGEAHFGEIEFQGELRPLWVSSIVKLRGKQIAMVFQDPMSSLNPGFTVGQQFFEMFRTHSNLSKSESRQKTIELLRVVRIADPADRVDRYPHELSGGMKQRILIALAISQEPALLIADEPTTALDTTVQVQVLNVLRSLQERLGMAMLFITHDIGVAAAMADRIAVIYAGMIVEEGTAEQVLKRPRHPYTQGLLDSAPSSVADKRSQPIPGAPPPGSLRCQSGADSPQDVRTPPLFARQKCQR